MPSSVMLSAIMLSAIMLSVIMLNAVVPIKLSSQEINEFVT